MKTTIIFNMKGWCNLYPVYIHYSPDRGWMFIPRGLPRLAYYWNWILDMFLEHDWFLITGELGDDKEIFIEMEETDDVVA